MWNFCKVLLISGLASLARQWLQEASKVRNTDEKLFEIPFEKQTLHRDHGSRIEYRNLLCRAHAVLQQQYLAGQ